MKNKGLAPQRLLLAGLLVAILFGGAGPLGNQATGRSAEPPALSNAAGLQTTITLYAAADAGLISAYLSGNFGHDPDMWVAYDHEGDSGVLLVRFDLVGALPADAIIDSAVMSLYMAGIDPVNNTLPEVNIGAYVVTDPWDEGTVTWALVPRAALRGVSAFVDTNPEYKSWGVTSQTQAWHADPAHNYGLLLYGPLSGSAYTRKFLTRENSSNRPRLMVTYHLPVPTSKSVLRLPIISRP